MGIITDLLIYCYCFYISIASIRLHSKEVVFCLHFSNVVFAAVLILATKLLTASATRILRKNKFFRLFLLLIPMLRRLNTWNCLFRHHAPNSKQARGKQQSQLSIVRSTQAQAQRKVELPRITTTATDRANTNVPASSITKINKLSSCLHAAAHQEIDLIQYIITCNIKIH